MDEMGGIAKEMPKTFTLFTAAAMASLALPGMSGFVGELTVFLGIATSDVYSPGFKVVVIFLTAIGLILTPIYLLSMLRQVFYGQKTAGLALDKFGVDANPREVFIALCLLIPIIGIGLYPKLATNTYDTKAVQVAAKIRGALPVIANLPIHNYAALPAPLLPCPLTQEACLVDSNPITLEGSGKLSFVTQD